MSIADRISLAVRQKNPKIFRQSLADAMCFIVTNTSVSLAELRELDVASFMVLLNYINRQLEAQNKAMRLGKYGRRYH